MNGSSAQFWAVVVCALGTGLGLAALWIPTADQQTRVQAFTLANTLVSGGLGAFTTAHIITKKLGAKNGPTPGPSEDPAQ